MSMAEKTCSKCGETMPLAAFHSDPRKHDGHKATCKDCWRKHYRDTARAKAKQPEPTAELFTVTVELPDEGSTLVALELQLTEWEQQGLSLPGTAASALRSAARAVDQGLMDMQQGKNSAYTFARTVDLYSQALERVQRMAPPPSDNHDPIDDLIRQLSTPTLGN